MKYIVTLELEVEADTAPMAIGIVGDVLGRGRVYRGRIQSRKVGKSEVQCELSYFSSDTPTEPQEV